MIDDGQKRKGPSAVCGERGKSEEWRRRRECPARIAQLAPAKKEGKENSIAGRQGEGEFFHMQKEEKESLVQSLNRKKNRETRRGGIASQGKGAE